MLTYYQQNSMSSCQQLTGPSLSFCPLRTTAESLNLSHLKNLHALRLFALIFLGKITQPLHLIFPEDKKGLVEEMHTKWRMVFLIGLLMAWQKQRDRSSVTGLAVGFFMTVAINILPVILALNFPASNTLTTVFQKRDVEDKTFFFQPEKILAYFLTYCDIMMLRRIIIMAFTIYMISFS